MIHGLLYGINETILVLRLNLKFLHLIDSLYLKNAHIPKKNPKIID